MAYVIAEPCSGTRDTACVDACPVGCIHPKKKNTSYEDGHPSLDEVSCSSTLTRREHRLRRPAYPSALSRRFLQWMTCRRSGSSTQT
jgi:NAD-dependent dihydropyrimidine dehydrogenase PreA subunit